MINKSEPNEIIQFQHGTHLAQIIGNLNDQFGIKPPKLRHQINRRKAVPVFRIGIDSLNNNLLITGLQGIKFIGLEKDKYYKIPFSEGINDVFYVKIISEDFVLLANYKCIKLVELPDKIKWVYEISEGNIHDIQASGSKIIVALGTKSAIILDTKSGKCIEHLGTQTDAICQAVAVSAGGNITAAGYLIAKDFSMVKLYQLDSSFKHCFVLNGKVRRIVFYKNRLYVAEKGGTISIWDFSDILHISLLQMFKYPGEIFDMNISSNGRLAIANNKDTAIVFDGDSFEKITTINTYAITSTIFLNNYIVVTANIYGKIDFWNIETGELLLSYYNLLKGFLWTEPDKDGIQGKFCTDQANELIDVYEGDDQNIQHILPVDDQLRKSYILSHNFRNITKKNYDYEAYKQQEDYFYQHFTINNAALQAAEINKKLLKAGE